MKNQTVILICTLMLLTSCFKNDSVENQKKIRTLTEENMKLNESVKQFQPEQDSLKRVISDLDTAMAKVQNSLKLEQSRVRVQKLLPVKILLSMVGSEVGSDSRGMSPLTEELLFSHDTTILNMINSKAPYSSYSVKERLSYVKGDLSGFYDASMSKNDKGERYKYIFQYLGDCIGADVEHVGYSYDDEVCYNWIYSTLRDKFNTPEYIDLLVDQLTDRIFLILEDTWRSGIERSQLYSALSYLHSTSGTVDYSATLDKNYHFTNRSYEENWNGIQKFFYRTEKKFPGSTARIRSNISYYLQTKGVK